MFVTGVFGGIDHAAGAIEVDGRHTNEDVEALVAASSIAADRALVNPYLFLPPIAPHIAAEENGTLIEANHIIDCFRQLGAMADIVVVEGVGGFRVPLYEGFDTADLASNLGLPVVLVVGMRLGCINHALLSADAIAGAGMELLGWVANGVDEAMSHREENIEALRERIAAPCLGIIPFSPRFDARAMGALLTVPILRAGII